MTKVRFYNQSILLMVLMLLNFGVLAQNSPAPPQNDSYESWYNYYSSFPSNEEEEDDDSEAAQFMKWAHFWQYRLTGGNIQEGLEIANTAIQNFIDGGLEVCEGSIDDNINWEELGPFNSNGGSGNGSGGTGNSGPVPGFQNQGRIEAISVNPDDKNDIVAGGINGGIWRSEDGGANWENKTDASGYTIAGTSQLVRHPENPEILYSATAGEFGAWHVPAHSTREYGVGVIKSMDSGDNWEKTSYNNNNTFGYTGYVSFMAIDPNSTSANTIIYLGDSFDNLFKYQGSDDAMGVWTMIYDGDGGKGINDIEIESDGTVWFTNQTGSGLYRIASNSETAIEVVYDVPASVTQPFTCSMDGITYDNPTRWWLGIDVNENDDILVAVRYWERQECDKEEAPRRFFYHTSDSGVNWDTPLPTMIYPFFGEFVMGAFDSQTVYMEDDDRRMRVSNNGGGTFGSMNNNQNHFDIRTVVSYLDENNNESIYIGTDGGISVTTDGSTWVDMTGEGLANTNYFGVAVTDSEKDFIFAGAQDGSINFYNKGVWLETGPIADNGDCLIDPNNTDIIYTTQQNTLRRSTNGISITGNGTNISPQGLAFMFPLLMNPNNSHELFVPASQSGTNRLAFSDNQGNSWTYLPTQNDARVTGVGISEENDDVMYVGLTSGIGVQRFNRLNGSWISQAAVNIGFDGPITDITVDPANHEKIWVSCGWFSDGNKVFHSDDGGASWVNASAECLPNITMTSIVYQKGSNDGIYLGSDFGVFYKNADMDEWIHYGNGGPLTMVADMEVNNCSNELIVATQGRGMWKVPMLPVTGDKEIADATGEVIWDTRRTVTQNITITEGTTLKIQNATINIAEGKHIFVEKGAQLIVENSTLTNLCGGMWQGIKIAGNSQESQAFCPNSPSAFPCHQGYVRISNESTIENAIIGVDVRGLRGGGILVASDSDFLNNETAVQFAPYQNTNPLNGQPTGNGSSFRLCDFAVDEDYIGNYDDMKQQVKLNAVTGIEFYACRFDNAHPDRTFINEGKIGIDSRDSEFIVTSTCTASQLPCPSENELPSEFSGFERAIFAHNEGAINTFRVTHTNFTDNHVGIMADGIPNAYIVKNNFFVGGELPFQDNLYRGLDLAECTGYQIEANVFSPSSNGGSSIGTCITASGDEPNLVYRNTYNGVFVGNVANKNNQATNPIFGLQYLCNTASENNFDYGIPADATIARNQGSETESAGNSFTENSPFSGWQFTNENMNNTLIYFCIDQADCPFNYTNNTIELEDPQFSHECASNLPDDNKGKLSETEKIQIETDIISDQLPVLNSPIKSDLVNRLMRNRLIDTLYYNIEEVRGRLTQKGNLKSHFTIVDSYLQENNAQLAKESLLQIAQNFELSDEIIGNEYQQFNALKNIQISAIEQGIGYETMVINNHNPIKIIADAGDYIGSNQAKRMINEVIGQTYTRTIQLPGNQPDMLIQSATGNNINVSFLQASIKAIPNPASNQTTFYFRLPEKTTKGEIIITNLFGRLIEKINVSEEIGKIQWETTNLVNDVYIYTLKADGKVIKSDRLVITK